MSDIFKNYPQPDDYVPNNRQCDCACCDGKDQIIIGGTTLHTFKLKFLYSEECDGFDIIYRQSLDKELIISSSSLGAPYEMEEVDGKTLITVTLSPETTSEFHPFRDTFAQIKLYMKDGSVIFGDKNRLEMISTLR